MKTEHLIAMLARGIQPAAPARQRQELAVTSAAGLTLGFIFLLLVFGLRPDIETKAVPVALKLTFSAIAAVLTLLLASRLLRPGRPVGWRLQAPGAFIIAAIAVTTFALLDAAPQERLRLWLGGDFPWCLVIIPFLGAPAAILLMRHARSATPTELTLTGAAIGAVSGAIGALIFSTFCTVDSVAYVATWYTAAIALSGTIGAFAGDKLLRW